MEQMTLSKFTKEQKRKFYQSKYEYYRSFNRMLITVAVLAYLSFFITDCGIFGRFAYETLLSRFFIIIPWGIYWLTGKKVNDYRIMVPFSYLMIHTIIWCTCWATYLLPDRQHAISGMVIMNLIFVCAGFASPFWFSTIAHLVIVADIAVANIFIQYENLQMMYLFNLPCVVAICVMHHTMQKVYFEQYVTKGKLEKLVVHDQLTEVFNRNKLKEISDSETGEFTMFADLDVSLMLIDIDYFKKVNDTYGHEAGDKVLVHLAKTLRTSVRASDYVIRWGGEEFLVIMPGCVGKQAFHIADKIRQKVEASDNSVCKTTISIGVSLYQGGDYHTAIKNADDALYRAKENGRNQVVVHESIGEI